MESSAFKMIYNQICSFLPTNHMLKFDFPKDSWPVSQTCFLARPDKLSQTPSPSPEDASVCLFSSILFSSSSSL